MPIVDLTQTTEYKSYIEELILTKYADKIEDLDLSPDVVEWMVWHWENDD